jgi:hypothetical protein
MGRRGRSATAVRCARSASRRRWPTMT